MNDNQSADLLYPEIDDPNFQSKIYKKREFYFHKIPQRDKLTDYEDIKKYRDEACGSIDFKPREQQAILSNFLNPNTPYNGLLVMHGTGVGKTATAILIAEQFKEQVTKYNTKVFVLVSGTSIRENFKNELLFATGDTYLKNRQIMDQLTGDEKDRERKMAIYSTMQFYRILSYKTFYRKVLGEKIVERKVVDDDRIVASYMKDEEGELLRATVEDKITNMDNSLLIIDEAHNLTGNEYGEALKKIIENSTNLKVILLTATPMKNLATDIVELLNFIRPKDDKLRKEKIFTTEKEVHLMDFKEGGKEYFAKKVSGYISYFRGSIPFTFAKRVDKGEIPDGLLFTPLIRCFMEEFQFKTYEVASKEMDDALDRYSSAASNFVFPGLDKDKKDIMGYYSNDGINKVIGQINSDKEILLNMINKKLFDNKLKPEILNNFIMESKRKNITGNILKLDYLKQFSIKFYKTISRLQKLVEGKKGAGTAFVYSNLKRAGGMELFADALEMNGYLEYNQDPNEYIINEDTIDAITGITFAEFKKKFDSKSFKPATFLLITGGGGEEGDELPEIKQKIIREVFNNPDNKNGANLKLVLGTRVMTEGVTLENTREVHILDVHYNLAKVEQVIGRAIRFCKHMAITNEDNPFPQVNVYRYVASISNKNKNITILSTDETLYQKAEQKYLLVKKVERLLKESAIDCPLLLHGNKFPEEIEQAKNCVPPTLENVKAGKNICPALCDFQECELKCKDPKLEDKYFDEKKKTYIDIPKNKLDFTSFNDDLAKFEIDNVKEMIKDLYKFKSSYTYNEILDLIKKSYRKEQAELFEEFFLDQALEELMPKTENQFNNFTDVIFDKFNRQGYLVQYDKYFIFQPFDENENTPYYYRQNTKIEYINDTPVSNYLKNKFGEVIIKRTKEEKQLDEEGYNFQAVLPYYTQRDENFIVGIIDRNQNRLATDEDDVFKVREPIKKTGSLRRGTGIPTFKGAVCFSSKSKGYLLNVLKKLEKLTESFKIPSNMDKAKDSSREIICGMIREQLMILEKYSTTKDGNKKTYLMVPFDHPNLPFPFNLEDRMKEIISKLKLDKNDYVVKKINGGNINDLVSKNFVSYEMEVKNRNILTPENLKKIDNTKVKIDKNKILLD